MCVIHTAIELQGPLWQQPCSSPVKAQSTKVQGNTINRKQLRTQLSAQLDAPTAQPVARFFTQPSFPLTPTQKQPLLYSTCIEPWLGSHAAQSLDTAAQWCLCASGLYMAWHTDTTDTISMHCCCCSHRCGVYCRTIYAGGNQEGSTGVLRSSATPLSSALLWAPIPPAIFEQQTQLCTADNC